jgi:hypothetical protein
MRTIKLYTLSAAAGLLLGGVAHAASVVRGQEGAARYPAPYWASLIGTGTSKSAAGAPIARTAR